MVRLLLLRGAELNHTDWVSYCLSTDEYFKKEDEYQSRRLNVYNYKWKNHFYEMKGDVGMSVHEKERKQEDAYTKTQTHS